MVITLLIFIIVREIIAQVTLQKMTNKIMSRNYAEYQTVRDKVEIEALRLEKESPVMRWQDPSQDDSAIMNGMI